MREVTVTIFVKDDGTVDLSRFSEVEELRPVKTLVDELRRENGNKRRENERLESTVSSLEAEVAEIKASSESATGVLKEQKAAVKELSKERDEAKAQLEAYTALGNPDDLKQLKETLDAYSVLGKPEDLQARLTDADYGRDRRSMDRITDVATRSQLKPEAVLALNGIRDWQIEDREVEVRNALSGAVTKATVPHVITNAETGEAKPFRDVVAERFAPLMAALDASSGKTNPTRETTPQRPAPLTTVPTGTSAAGTVTTESLSEALHAQYGA